MKTHYHVISGMGGGYTPDNNYYADTKRDAQIILADIKNDWREDTHDTSDNRTVHGAVKLGFITLTDNANPYDLGYYAEIVSCTEDCDPDADYY